jgi:hypothetical protein
MLLWFPPRLLRPDFTLVFVVLALLSGRPLSAQYSWEAPPPRPVIALSVVPWLNPVVPGASLSVLTPIRRDASRRLYLRYEGGAIFRFNFKDFRLDTQDDRGLGWALKGGARASVSLRRMRRAVVLVKRTDYQFQEITLGYRYMEAGIPGEFSRVEGLYRQRYDYSMRDHAISLAAGVGMQTGLGRNGHVEGSMQVGIRMRRPDFSTAQPLPDDANFVGSDTPWGLWAYEEAPRWRASFFVNFTALIGRKLGKP